MKDLTSTREVILALGGISSVAALTKRKYSAAANWQNVSDTFPPDTYRVMNLALAERRLTAPPSLWRMMELAQ